MTVNGLRSIFLISFCVLCSDISASEPIITPTASDTPPAASPLVTGRVLKANTVIEIQLLDSVSSRANKPGDMFKMRLARPVIVDASEVIPMDTIVIGEVVHAAKSGFGGKAGELIVAARYIDTTSGRIKLRSSFGASGVNSVTEAATLLAIAGAVGFVIKGTEKELPSGTLLSARVAADTVLTSGQ